MSLIHSPRIVTDGLKLVLDAGVPTSWNAGISTNWTDKIGGNNGTLVGGTYHNDGPFVGAGYVEFDGTGDTLTLSNTADHQFGSSDYTIESWVYLNNLSTVQGLFGRYNTSSAREIYITFNTNGSITHRTSSNGTSFSTHLTSAGLLTANTWHHVAISKSGTTSYIAVDGVVVTGTVDATLHSASQTTYIGDALAGSNLLNGNLSNYRILKGTALYTSNFTPPSSPLTAVTNTTLLCCQGATNVDASPSAHSFQVIIGVPTLTSVGPSATKYFEFDGTNDAVDVGNVNPTSGATFSAWININGANTNYGGIFTRWGAGGNSFWIGTKIDQSSTIQVFFNGSLIHDITSLALNTWMLLTVSHTGSNATSYINGIQKNTNSASLISSTGTTSIGYDINRTDYPFKGNIAQVSIYNRALTAAEITQNYNATKGRYA